MKTEIAFFAAGYISATFITLFIVFQYLRYKEQPDEVVEESTIKESLNVEKPKQQNKQPKFEAGKLYKLLDNDFLIYCTKSINEDEIEGFGFMEDGNWMEHDVFITEGLVEATEDEWLERLTEKAKKLGFKRGVRYKSTKYFSYANEVCKGTKLRLNANGMGMQTLCEAGSTFIMQDGKWAEIIE